MSDEVEDRSAERDALLKEAREILWCIDTEQESYAFEKLVRVLDKILSAMGYE